MHTRRLFRKWPALLLAGSLYGCALEPESDPTEELSACRGELSDDDVRDAVLITDEYGDSMHELVACGSLSATLCSTLIDGVIDAVLKGSHDAMPEGWQFVEGGTYRAVSGLMEAGIYVTEDFSFARAGERVPHNLFLVDNYLTNARVEIDLRSGDTTIRYDAAGPLVELLGFGAEPPNPLPVELDARSSLKRKLRQLEFAGHVTVQDERKHAVITYSLDIPPVRAEAFVNGASALRYVLESADGSRADLRQQIVTRLFDVSFVQQGSLKGTADLQVQGGPLEYDAHLVWNDSGFPEQTLSCPDAN